MLGNVGGTSTIHNGGSHGKTGIILGAESGVRTVNDFMVDVQNFSQGAILGNGASFINPAIFLDTRGSEGRQRQRLQCRAGEQLPVAYFRG